MKKTNLLIGIAVAAMSLSLSGCMLANGSFGNNIIDYSSKKNNTTNAEATASINKKNESATEFIRGMRTFDRNKKGITARIVMENAESEPGVMGIVFDMKKNSDKTVNFVLLGVGYKDNAPRTYISVYRNVKEEYLDKKDLGTEEAGSPTTRTDIKITGANAANYFYFDNTLLNGTTLNVVVEIQALTEAEDSTNAYAVRYYKENGEDLTTYIGLSEKTNADAPSVRSSAIKTVMIPRDKIDNSTGTVQEKMGFYANVYGYKTLKGEWQVADMAHQPNVAKTAADDDDSFIKLNF